MSAGRRVELRALAHARSGDKGDTANVGLIARRARDYALLVREVTAARVARHFAGLIRGPVERFELPNLRALNFLLHGALDGGGTSSLWWATKNEWLGLLDVAGLEVEALYGGFDRRPFDDESREYVFVTRRPAR